MNKQKSNGLVVLVFLILALAILVTFGYFYYQNFIAVKKQINQANNSSTTKPITDATNTATMTNDQIFNQVSSQLNLTRDQLAYFRIFGQDKVQYNSGGGATFVYEISGSWKIAQENAQSVSLCSDLIQVPEIYRPPCSESNSTSSKTLYVDANHQSTNYPPSSMISYIGQ